jgi:hypothetical protein
LNDSDLAFEIYRHKPESLDTACELASYFENCLLENKLPRATDISSTPAIDSQTASISTAVAAVNDINRGVVLRHDNDSEVPKPVFLLPLPEPVEARLHMFPRAWPTSIATSIALLQRDNELPDWPTITVDLVNFFEHSPMATTFDIERYSRNRYPDSQQVLAVTVAMTIRQLASDRRCALDVLHKQHTDLIRQKSEVQTLKQQLSSRLSSLDDILPPLIDINDAVIINVSDTECD